VKPYKIIKIFTSFRENILVILI